MTNDDAPLRRRHPSSALPGRNSRIRDNLIFKLGVVKVEPSKRQPSRGSMLGNVTIYVEPLKSKDICEEVREEGSQNFTSSLANLFAKKTSLSEREPSSLRSSPTDTDTSSDSAPDRSRKLTFNEKVTVCPIPKREEYSKRIKEHLWQSPAEMRQNTQRNSIEFAAEGWDWRNTLEDDRMYRCVATNELIHPVHIDQQQIQ